MAVHRFETTLQAEDGGPAVFDEVPEEVRHRLGTGVAGARCSLGEAST